jgi:hypothetical protein
VFDYIQDKEKEILLAPYVKELDELDDIFDDNSSLLSSRFGRVLQHCLRRSAEETVRQKKIEFLTIALAWCKLSPCTDVEMEHKKNVFNALQVEFVRTLRLAGDEYSIKYGLYLTSTFYK